MLEILLIDDDPIEFKLIERMLKDCYKRPFTLRFAQTLEKAIIILKTQDTDIVLLDDKLNHGLTAKDSVPAIKRIKDSAGVIHETNGENLRKLTLPNTHQQTH